MKILAIETSCDETSVSVVENGSHVLSLVVNSQIDIHKAFGGVVPEIAARSHVEVMIPVIEQALEEAFGGAKTESQEIRGNSNEENVKIHNSGLMPHTSTSNHWKQIDAIAVTQGPGLLGSLLIGALTARTLAWSMDKPLYGVHHILGHVYANWIISGPEFKTPYPTSKPEFPVLALIVSGGHTQLMLGTDHTNWRVIGRTQDDAVGEAFDKVAKVLGLPYPGGVSVSELAKQGDPSRYKLPTPVISSLDPSLVELRRQIEDRRLVAGDNDEETSPTMTYQSQNSQSSVSSLQSPDSNPATSSYNFSFSGLKTAVLRAVQKECGVSHQFPSFELAERLNEVQKADFAASFQYTAINYLVSKTKAAFEEFSPKSVIIGGGVAASLPLRAALSKKLAVDIQYAPQILCTDNAAMIGARAYFQSQSEEPVDPTTLEVVPSWPL